MIKYEGNHYGQNNERIVYNPHNLNYPKHLHRSYELIYVNSGCLKVTVEGREFFLFSGDSLLIFPHKIHSIETVCTSDMYLSLFSPEYIPDFTKYTENKYPKYPVFRLTAEEYSMFIPVLFSQGPKPWSLKSAYYFICQKVLDNGEFIETNTLEYAGFHDILIYAQNHFTKDLSLKTLAAQFGYNYSYLSRAFKNLLGCSFVDYINESRINYAVFLIQTTDISITDIAFECGYKTIRSFNRNFLNIVKMPPSSLRTH